MEKELNKYEAAALKELQSVFFQGMPLIKLVEKNYTERQLAIFIVENPEAIVISCTVNYFHLNNNERKFCVIDKYDGFLHSGSKGKYHIPNESKQIFVVE